MHDLFNMALSQFSSAFQITRFLPSCQLNKSVFCKPFLQKGGADENLDQNKVNNRRRSRTCIPTRNDLKP